MSSLLLFAYEVLYSLLSRRHVLRHALIIDFIYKGYVYQPYLHNWFQCFTTMGLDMQV